RLDTSGADVVEGNFLGTSADGKVPLGNRTGVSIFCANNLIGGQTPSARNIISGNGSGVFMLTSDTTGNLIQGNLIGTDPTGNVAVPNGAGFSIQSGTSNTTIGGLVPQARNVISGNSSDGIDILSGTTGTLVQGNFIGTNASGTAALGNAFN